MLILGRINSSADPHHKERFDHWNLIQGFASDGTVHRKWIGKPIVLICIANQDILASFRNRRRN